MEAEVVQCGHRGSCDVSDGGCVLLEEFLEEDDVLLEGRDES